MIDEIAMLLAAEPFVPFSLVLTSGDRYTVTNPDLALVLESLVYLYRARSERRDVLRLNQLAAIEVLEPAAPVGS